MILNELRFQDARTKTYLGSPALVRLPDGALLASHDYFGPGCPKNHQNEEHLTTLYRSEDDGASWSGVTHIADAFWSSLFVRGSSVYLLGTTQQYGSIVIRRSDDGGFTWTTPATEKTGRLFLGGVYHATPNYHCAPVPVLFANGRIYRAFEDNNSQTGEWGCFQALVISAPDNADLLDASQWTMSNKLDFPASMKTVRGTPLPRPAWLEGNAVLAPSGEIWNILRFNAEPLGNLALCTRLSADGTTLTFDAATGLIDLPGGGHKFSIQRFGHRYIALVNPSLPCGGKIFPWQRNILDVIVSEDLEHWRTVETLLSDDSELSPEESVGKTGFQYVDWIRDGDDLLYLVRTAYDGAHTFHDSNRITFHRRAGFFPWLEKALG